MRTQDTAKAAAESFRIQAVRAGRNHCNAIFKVRAVFP